MNEHRTSATMGDNRGWPVSICEDEPHLADDATEEERHKFLLAWYDWGQGEIERLRNANVERARELTQVRKVADEKEEALKGLEAYLRQRREPLKVFKPGEYVMFADPVIRSTCAKKMMVHSVTIRHGEQVEYEVSLLENGAPTVRRFPALMLVGLDEEPLPFRAADSSVSFG